jgi:hypothetical protein
MAYSVLYNTNTGGSVAKPFTPEDKGFQTFKESVNNTDDKIQVNLLSTRANMTKPPATSLTIPGATIPTEKKRTKVKVSL